MPEKIKKSIKMRNKLTNKYEIHHYYLKTASIIELRNIVNDKNTKLKIKAKCIKELNRRKKI
jgi:hypothetical protein